MRSNNWKNRNRCITPYEANQDGIGSIPFGDNLTRINDKKQHFNDFYRHEK